LTSSKCILFFIHIYHLKTFKKLHFIYFPFFPYLSECKSKDDANSDDNANSNDDDNSDVDDKSEEDANSKDNINSDENANSDDDDNADVDDKSEEDANFKDNINFDDGANSKDDAKSDDNSESPTKLSATYVMSDMQAPTMQVKNKFSFKLSHEEYEQIAPKNNNCRLSQPRTDMFYICFTGLSQSALWCSRTTTVLNGIRGNMDTSGGVERLAGLIAGNV